MIRKVRLIAYLLFTALATVSIGLIYGSWSDSQWLFPGLFGLAFSGFFFVMTLGQEAHEQHLKQILRKLGNGACQPDDATDRASPTADHPNR